jgi:diguanylate cyclase (GGDEF)-like protein
MGVTEHEAQGATACAPRFGGASIPVVALAVGYFVLYLLWQLTRLGGTTHTVVIGDAFALPIDALAIYSTAAAANRCRADRRRFWSWILLSGAMAGYAVGDLLQLDGEGVRHAVDSPDVSDALFYLLFFCGLVGLAISRRTAVRRWLYTIDTLVVALGAGSVLWYLVAGPLTTTRGHPVHAVVYAVLFPLGDLILLVTAVKSLQRGVPFSSVRAVRMIAFGILLYVVADTWQSYLGLHGGYHGGDAVDIFGIAAAVAFAVAGTLQRPATESEGSAPTAVATGSARMSYGAVVVLYVLALGVEWHGHLTPEIVLVAGCVLASALMALSQVLSRRTLGQEQTKNAGLVEELRYQAFHDTLTGLANRALFNERLEHALARRRSFLSQHAVLMIDLNAFKEINDSLGHEAGDRVLRTVAARLVSSVRSGDTVARFGGDEFAVLLEDVAGAEAAVHLVEHLLAVVREPLVVARRTLVPQASVGIAITGREQVTAPEMLRSADTAMYRAKTQHSAHFCVFEPEMLEVLTERLELEEALRGAMERRELRVFYQPIVNLMTRETTDFEALVRWMHPTRGLLPPAAFLPLAEQLGLLHDIDSWVLAEACREAGRWQRENVRFAGIGVHVNMSPAQLRQPDLITMVQAALTDAGLAAGCLTLELLESSVLDDLALAGERLTELKSLGVRIAVDDFGTGYSSLSHLRTLPIDVLKIDSSFVAAIETSAQASALVRSLIHLGAALGIETVAEGIEEVAQLQHLREDECVQGQGYLFARPLDCDGLQAYLSDVSAQSERAEWAEWAQRAQRSEHRPALAASATALATASALATATAASL